MVSYRSVTRILLFASLMSCVTSSHMYVLAQQSTHPCRDEIRAWASQEMVPVMRQWKNEFDASLSTEERQKLDVLRLQAKEMARQRRSAIREFMDSQSAGDEDARESRRRRLREMRWGMEDDWEGIIRELTPIAKAHKDILVSIGTKAAPQMGAWKKIIRTKLEECRSSHGMSPGKTDGHFARLFEDWLMMDPGSASQSQKRRSAIRFMLWDGSDIPADESSSTLTPDTRAGVTNMTGTFTLSQCSPNPVNSERTNIRFSLSKTDHVKISILDVQGSEVLVVSDKQFAAGSNVCEAAVGSLPNGQYSVRLVSSEGMLYTALIIAR